jgi:hypothetical protein
LVDVREGIALVGLLTGCGGLLIACGGPTFDVVPSADATTISNIDLGVLFVDARWSVPSVRARGTVETRIEGLPLQLVIADIDKSPALSEMPALENKLSGAGESIWVRDGAICFVCTRPDCVDAGIASLISSDPASLLQPSSC